MKKNFIMVRPGKKGNVLQELSDLAALPKYGGNESAVVRDAVHDKWLLEYEHKTRIGAIVDKLIRLTRGGTHE